MASARATQLSYHDRSNLPNTPALTAYLLRLMTHKSTNLCLSADVQTTAELLDIAEEVGPYICVLKTHADIVRDFSDRTIHALADVARRHKFLLFEDRKFGDIGNTVQTQYAGGTHRIASWAYLVNAHVFPGPGVIEALKAAAFSAIATENSQITTEISGGGHISEELQHYIREEKQRRRQSGLPPLVGDSSSEEESDGDAENAATTAATDERGRSPRPHALRMGSSQRKGSVVSVSTTISSSAEYISPPATSNRARFSLAESATTTPSVTPPATLDLPVAGDPAAGPPFARGLLLLAQMSSKGNLMTPEYTTECYNLATQHREFVLGFIAQESLNRAPDDNFLTMTPGISLPPPEVETADKAKDTSGPIDTSGSDSAAADKKIGDVDPAKRTHKGDALGQQYNTPRLAILEKGTDVVIVGRGILNAKDRGAEAKRYRDEAWRAYLARIKG
ncbi:MAG: hypothetical protein Q9162_004099 [Coniocarpon cinnabarinum]